MEAKDIDETNERCSKRGGRRGNCGDISVTIDCDNAVTEGSSVIMLTSMAGDTGGVGSKSVVTPNVNAGAAKFMLGC